MTDFDLQSRYIYSICWTCQGGSLPFLQGRYIECVYRLFCLPKSQNQGGSQMKRNTQQIEKRKDERAENEAKIEQLTQPRSAADRQSAESGQGADTYRIQETAGTKDAPCRT